jgi:deazaflavin-dependent oxidoreductase (nitroreductase family)
MIGLLGFVLLSAHFGLKMKPQDQFLYVTTTGRKTGLPREIEIWFVEGDERFYILAEHGYKTQWVQNILSDSRVHVRLGDERWNGLARVLDPDQDSDVYFKARNLAREKYGWGDGLPVEIRRV